MRVGEITTLPTSLLLLPHIRSRSNANTTILLAGSIIGGLHGGYIHHDGSKKRKMEVPPVVQKEFRVGGFDRLLEIVVVSFTGQRASLLSRLNSGRW